MLIKNRFLHNHNSFEKFASFFPVRYIELAMAASGAKTEAFRRLPTNVVPEHYELDLKPDLEGFTFSGRTSIRVRVSSLKSSSRNSFVAINGMINPSVLCCPWLTFNYVLYIYIE